jgi:glycosyltransferase involved in cell wall biosynthesis
VVIAGGAQNKETENYFEKLRRQAEKDCARIVFTGPVEGELKYELLSNCRIFATPSQDEGLPIALLEAFSYGRVCLASDIPAHREIIEDKISGYLFQPHDKTQFIEMLIKLWKQSARELDAVASRAQQTVDAKYNWDLAAARYESIYTELLKKDGR